MPISQPIRLLLSCQDGQLALNMCSTVVQAGNGRIAGQSAQTGHTLSMAAATKPHVLLLEHSRADEQRSWRLVARLHEVSVGTRILLLSDASEQLKVVNLIERGVDGCLFKTSEPALAAKAVIAVHGGDTWFGRTALLEALRSRMAASPSPAPPGVEETESLTQREREILGLIGKALTNKEIAKRLKISDNTVKTHLHRIYVKLHRSGRYKAFMSNNGPLAGELSAGHARPTQ